MLVGWISWDDLGGLLSGGWDKLGPAVLLVTGALLTYFTTSKAEARRSFDEAERSRVDRQRQCLYDLQDAAFELSKHIIKLGSDKHPTPYVKLTGEVGRDLSSAASRVSVIAYRITDESCEALAHKFSADATDILNATTAEEQRSKAFAAATTGGPLNLLLGSLLKGAYA